MKNNDNIDKLFHSEFDNFVPPPPPDAWDNIERQIAKKDKRRAFFFWYFVGGLCLLLAGFSYGFYARGIQQNTASKTETLTINKSSIIEKVNTNVSPTLFKTVNFEQQNLSTNNVSNQKHTTQVTNNQLFINKNKKQLLFNNSKLIIQKNNYFNENITKSTTPSTIKNTIKNELVNVESTTSEISKSDINIAENTNKASNIFEKQTAFSMLSLSVLKFDYVQKMMLQLPKKPIIDCFNFKKKNNAIYYVEAFFGPEYAIRKLSTKGSEPNNYIQSREDSERNFIAYSTGIRGGLVTKFGLAVRGGLSLSHNVERMDYVNLWEKRIIETRDPISGATTQSVQFGQYTRKVYNRITTTDIPLQIGFETNHKKSKWNQGIYIGGIYNMATYSSGEILNPAGVPIRFDNINSPYRLKGGYSLTADLLLRYELNEHLSITMEPSVRYQLKSITKDEYPLSQKYTNVGLHFGLRYGF